MALKHQDKPGTLWHSYTIKKRQSHIKYNIHSKTVCITHIHDAKLLSTIKKISINEYWYTTYKLVCQEKDCLEGKLSGTEVEEVFQGWSQQLHHHNIVVPFRPTPLDPWDAYTTSHHLVQAKSKVSIMCTLDMRKVMEAKAKPLLLHPLNKPPKKFTKVKIYTYVHYKLIFSYFPTIFFWFLLPLPSSYSLPLPLTFSLLPHSHPSPSEQPDAWPHLVKLGLYV